MNIIIFQVFWKHLITKLQTTDKMAEYNGAPTINVLCILTRDSGNFSYSAEVHNVPSGPVYMAKPLPDFPSLRAYLSSEVPKGYSIVSQVDIEGLKKFVRFKGRKALQDLLTGALSMEPGSLPKVIFLDKNMIANSGNEPDGIIVHLFDGWVTINDGKSNYSRPLNQEEKQELSDIVQIE